MVDPYIVLFSPLQFLITTPADNGYIQFSLESTAFAITNLGLKRSPADAVEKYAKAEVTPITFARKTPVPPAAAIAELADPPIRKPDISAEIKRGGQDKKRYSVGPTANRHTSGAMHSVKKGTIGFDLSKKVFAVRGDRVKQ